LDHNSILLGELNSGTPLLQTSWDYHCVSGS